MSKVARLKPKVVDLKSALEEFLLYKAADGAAKRTLSDYTYHVNTFLAAYPNLPDYDTLRKAVLEYLARPVSPTTRNIRLRYLKAFFNWCVNQGYLPANPTTGIRRAKEDLDHVRHISLEDVKKLLSAPDKKTYTGLRDYCLMLLQIDTGARPGELFQLRVEDLNLESREIRIRPEAAKTRVGRTLPISPYVAQVLQKFLEVRPEWWNRNVPLFATETGNTLNSSQWSKRLAKHCRKAGVKVTPYGLRHSFALNFLKASNDPFALQRMLGHKDLTMTRRYIRLTQDDIQELHEKASPVQKLQSMGKKASRKINNRMQANSTYRGER